MSDLFGNPEDRFCPEAAHIILGLSSIFKDNEKIMTSFQKNNVITWPLMEELTTF